MPLIIRKPRDVLLFRSGVASTARSLSEMVDQLQEQLRTTQEQLRAALEQNDFNCREHESQIATLMRDLLAAKYELAQRDARDAFAAAPSPSAAVH
jgi:threonine aldolase